MQSFKKYFQLVCEVTVEQVKTRFESRAWNNAIEKIRQDDQIFSSLAHSTHMFYSSRLSEAILQTIPNDIRESDKGNALNWVISTFLLSKDIVEAFADFTIAGEAGVVQRNLEFFYQIKQLKPEFLPIKAIEQIKTFKQLEEVIATAKPHYDKYLHDKAEKDTKTDISASKVLETDKWLVYIPKTKGAAIQLGKGTEWCTAAPGLNYYEQYAKIAPLIIFIRKDDPKEKYQFWYGKSSYSEAGQFMDKDDYPVDPDSKLFFELHSLVHKFANIHPSFKASLNFNYEELEGGGYVINRVTPNGNRSILRFNANGDLHSETHPASITYRDRDIIQEWYINGVISRIGGPAIIYKTFDDEKKTKLIEFTKRWVVDGKPFRPNGKPNEIALFEDEFDSGSHFYSLKYLDESGNLHREDGPAEIIIDKRSKKIIQKMWMRHGQLHREDGPAYYYKGEEYYYLNGNRVTVNQFFDKEYREKQFHDYF